MLTAGIAWAICFVAVALIVAATMLTVIKEKFEFELRREMLRHEHERAMALTNAKAAPSADELRSLRDDVQALQAQMSFDATRRIA